jgi:hypothetical protein
MTSTFQDREEALKEICAPVSQSLLLNVYGEAGIGKSRLLKEIYKELEKHETSPPMVLLVDMEDLKDIPADQRKEALLHKIVEESQNRIKDIGQDAARVVIQLNDLAKHVPVYLMFDTTEALQEAMSFWDWIQEDLVEPLVIEGKVKQIFAGRVPVPWRRFELRRTVKLLPLGPIKPYSAITHLIEENLKQANPTLHNEEILGQAIDLVLEFSFGHPGLSEKIALYIAPRLSTTSQSISRTELCKQVIEPFINEFLFGDVEPPWIDILWWASVLDWFDPTILQRYLTHIAPDLAQGQADYFFIQGITRLRTRNTVVWREERGDRLHGVIHDIVRQCLKTLDPKKYIKACEAAAQTFREIGDEFPEGEEAQQDFYNEAQSYEKRAKVMEEMA